MQTLNAVVEEVVVDADDEEYDRLVAEALDYLVYKKAEAHFRAQLKEDLEALENGTLKTYTREEVEATFPEWDKELDAEYEKHQKLRA